MLSVLSQWRDHFPYETPREIQEQALDLLAESWDRYDVFVVRAPTAFGKTSLAKTLMNALHSVSVITPTNLLVDQFRQEFPETCSLSRLDSYSCEEWKRPCTITRGKLLKFCKGCPAGRDLSVAKYRRGPGIYNYHTYLAYKLYRDVLVVDEAHNLIPTIKDRLALKLWRHDYRYPGDLWNRENVVKWIRTLSPKKQASKKIQLLKEAAQYQVPNYVYQLTKDWFNGKGTLRNEPEERELIKLLPVDIREAPALFWPREVQKIVLMSATIGEKDIDQLGLGGRRVCYIDCKSPIHPGVRPILIHSVTSVNRNNMEDAASKLAEYIQNVAAHHEGEKGVIHATYQMANLLRKHLTGTRYMFHDRDTKKEQYRAFRESSPIQGGVLVASGMYEGIDLPADLGRWQVISKIPWMSLADPATRHISTVDPDLYLWETIKTVVQAAGRICRTPDDFGVTYIPDKSVYRLLIDGKHLIPEYFLDALKFE